MTRPEGGFVGPFAVPTPTASKGVWSTRDGLALMQTTGWPQPAPTGMDLWLDADDSSTFSYSSGSIVSQWNDKSGNARHFAQSTVSLQPTRTTNVQNGRAGVYFYPSSSKKIITNSSWNWASGAFTAYVVFYATSSSGSFPPLLTRDAGGTLSLGGNNAAPCVIGISKIGNTTAVSTLRVTGTNADVLCYQSSGISSGSVTVTFFRNGTKSETTASLSSLSTGTISAVGGDTGGAGDAMNANAFICEIMVWQSSLSDADRLPIDNYLRWKWGTP